MEDIKKSVNGFHKNVLVEAQQKESGGDATLPGVGNEKVNDTSIPFDVDGDDEIQQKVRHIKLPNDTLKKSDKSIYPDKEDRLPRKDRIPSEIRNDDNPADIGI